MRSPINSRKHYVQHTTFQVVTGTVTSFVEITALNQSVVDAPNEVAEGATIKAIFIEMWLLGTFNEGSFVLMLEKSSQNANAPTLSEMTTLDAYDNKKNILFVSQGLIAEDSNSNPTPVLRQWIKIPKGKQRFGLNDKFRINIAAIGAEDVQGCGFSTYKDYT